MVSLLVIIIEEVEAGFEPRQSGLRVCPLNFLQSGFCHTKRFQVKKCQQIRRQRGKKRGGEGTISIFPHNETKHRLVIKL